MTGNLSANLIAALNELRDVASTNESRQLLRDIDDEIRKNREQCFFIVVLGQFKRGKSTFINALLGESLLPTAVLPVTTVVTLLRYGSALSVTVAFEDGRSGNITLDQIPLYVTEKDNPKNEKGVRYVEVEYPCPLLADGVVLVDTPGVGSLLSHNTALTEEFLPRIDAAILVTSIDPPFTPVELDFVNTVSEHSRRIFFVLNKIDTVTESEIIEAQSYLLQSIRQVAAVSADTVYPLSARNALMAREGEDRTVLQQSRIEVFEQALKDFLNSERHSVAIEGARRRFAWLKDRLITELRFKLKTFKSPLDELSTRIAVFEEGALQLQRELQEQEYVFDGEIRRLIGGIEDELREFERLECQRLLGQLQRDASSAFNGGRSTALRQPLNDVMSQLKSDLDTWREANLPKIRDQFSAILQRHATRIEGYVEAITQAAASAFDIPAPHYAAQADDRIVPSLTYKTVDDPVFFDIDLLRMTSRFLPRFLRRSWTMRRISEEIRLKTNLNCGRMLSGLREVISNKAVAFRIQSRERVDEAKNHFVSIVASSQKSRAMLSDGTGEEIAKLGHDIERLEKLNGQYHPA